MKNLDIIVRRYNENILWLNDILKISSFFNINIYVYNSGKNDLNYLNTKVKIHRGESGGREMNSYCNYIINNYNNLPDIMIFTQAIPDNYSTDKIIADIKDIENIYDEINETQTYSPISYKYIHYYKDGSPCHAGIPLENVFNYLFDSEMKDKNYFWCNAQFIVTKELILNNSIDFYKRILDLLKLNTNDINLEYYCIERFWGFIFNNNIRKRI